MSEFTTLMSKFSEQCYSVCDYDKFKPEKYFSSYHHYEVYNPENEYEKGKKITDDQLNEVNLKRHKFHPEWNYTIKPK